MRSVFHALAAAAALTVTAAPGRAGDAPDATSALQVMADVTLIDARCRGITVYFDALFRYGEDHGIAAASIFPLGPRRKAFETALAWRQTNATPDELCTSVIDNAEEAAPGVLKRP